jgi:hypothetical protein
MQFTVNIEDADVVRLMTRHPDRALTEIVKSLIADYVSDVPPPSKKDSIKDSIKENAARKKEKADTMARQLLDHVLETKPVGSRAFRPMDAATELFGDLMHDDIPLRTSIGISFPRHCEAHRKAARSGDKVVVLDESVGSPSSKHYRVVSL